MIILRIVIVVSLNSHKKCFANTKYLKTYILAKYLLHKLLKQKSIKIKMSPNFTSVTHVVSDSVDMKSKMKYSNKVKHHNYQHFSYHVYTTLISELQEEGEYKRQREVKTKKPLLPLFRFRYLLK